MKEEFTLSVEFGYGDCIHMLFSDGTKRKIITFIDDDPFYDDSSIHRYHNNPYWHYYIVSWLIDVGIGLLKNVKGEYSLGTEYSTEPSFVSFFAKTISDGNVKIKIHDNENDEKVTFIAPIGRYAEQVIILSDKYKEEFSRYNELAREYYSTEGKLEQLKKLLHARS